MIYKKVLAVYGCLNQKWALCGKGRLLINHQTSSRSAIEFKLKLTEAGSETLREGITRHAGGFLFLSALA